jgi:hypothetical protein
MKDFNLCEMISTSTLPVMLHSYYPMPGIYINDEWTFYNLLMYNSINTLADKPEDIVRIMKAHIVQLQHKHDSVAAAMISKLHLQKVTLFGCHIQTFQTVCSTSAALSHSRRCPQTHQDNSHVLLIDSGVVELYAGCPVVWLIGYLHFRTTEISVQICHRLEQQLITLQSSVGDWVPCSLSSGF